MAVSDQMQMAFSEAAGQDPLSGNDVPVGSLPEEVRDDVPAMLSEGEYVVPADVLRFYGLKFFEDLRSEAKMSLAQMDSEGRIGGEPLEAGSPAVSSSELPEGLDPTMLQASDGGTVGFKDGGVQRAVDAGYPKSPIENANTGLDKYMAAVTTPPEPKPMYRGGMAGYALGGSVEDLFADMDNYADGGSVVSGYGAGGAADYLNLQQYFPRQNRFDPMDYGLGFSANLIKPATPYKTAETIQSGSGVVEDEGETEAERRARRAANAEDPNNPDGVMGKSFSEMSNKDLKDFSGLLSKISPALAKNYPGLAEAQAKMKEFTDMESATYSDDSVATGGFTGYEGDAENAGGAPSSDEGTSGTGGYGMFNQGAFISRRKKT
tara:strand:+ start:25 stop:1158 length:1134 start_codon:yes stop_codon:yes gene_type:complete